jgi:hypothetical protein
MVKKILVCAVISAVFLCAVPAGAGSNIQEGLWEITTEVKMSGMQVPPQKHTQCFTKEDMVPVDPNNPQGCVVKEKNINGNTVNWTMECSTSGATTVSKGSITYAGDSFSGKMETTVKEMNMEMTSIMSGRRIGPCK